MNRDNSYTQTPEFGEAIRQGLLRHYALHPMTEETKEKMRLGNLGKVMSPESCRRISESKMGKPSLKKGKPQPSSSYKRSEETKRRMAEGRKLMLQNHPEIMESVSRKLSERVVSKKTKGKISESKKQFYVDHPEVAKAHSEWMKGKTFKSATHSATLRRLWRDPNYVRRIMGARNLKPNKAEIALDKILQEVCPNHFKYNGDFRLGIVLNRSIPDFVNVNGKKQVIELFGTYWHNQEGRGEQEKMAKYKEVGWNCLVVWDPELSETDALKDKIRAFVGGVLV